MKQDNRTQNKGTAQKTGATQNKNTTPKTGATQNKGTALQAAHLAKYAGAPSGLEAMEGQDFFIPQMLVAQALSPQVNRKDEAYIEGLQVGDIFNSMDGEILAQTEEPLQIQIIKATKSRKLIAKKTREVLCFSANGVDGGRISKSCATCAKATMMEEDGCTKFINYLVRLPEHPGIGCLMLQMKRGSMRIAKQINSQLRLWRHPAFTMLWEFSTYEDTSNKLGSFANWRVRSLGAASEEQCAIGLELAEAFANKDVKIHNGDGYGDGTNADEEDDDVSI